MQPDPTVRKVLIYRLGSLSDTVVALPCFHLIARMFPRAERVLLTNFPAHSKAPASAAVLGDSDLVHSYMRYPVGTRRVDELLRLAWKIRRFRAELLVYLTSSRPMSSSLMPTSPMKNISRVQMFFRMAGVRRIVGLPDEEGLKHRFDATTGLYEPEASRLARTIAALGDANPENIANWNLRLTAAEKNTATYALTPVHGRRLIACAPGCKVPGNDWEWENWRALLGRVSRKYPAHVLVMAGAKEDAKTCDYAAQDWAGDKLNLAGILSPRECAAVFAHAEIFIGPDFWPKHLAACMGIPCVCVLSARDLPGVSVDEMEQAVDRVLSGV